MCRKTESKGMKIVWVTCYVVDGLRIVTWDSS